MFSCNTNYPNENGKLRSPTLCPIPTGLLLPDMQIYFSMIEPFACYSSQSNWSFHLCHHTANQCRLLIFREGIQFQRHFSFLFFSRRDYNLRETKTGLSFSFLCHPADNRSLKFLCRRSAIIAMLIKRDYNNGLTFLVISPQGVVIPCIRYPGQEHSSDFNRDIPIQSHD